MRSARVSPNASVPSVFVVSARNLALMNKETNQVMTEFLNKVTKNTNQYLS